MTRERILILGNGPSLRGVDLPGVGISTMGMNAAYRAWDRWDWAPDYYLCLDHQLILSHADYIAASAASGRFRAMFLAASVLDLTPEIKNAKNVIFIDQFFQYWWKLHGERSGLERRTEPFFETEDKRLLTTGSYAVRWAAALGYRDIGLIGIDCRYEPLPEWSRIQGSKIGLEMAETPQSNPNYFFDDYQQRGDLFNVPNPSTLGLNLHLEAVRQADLDVRDAAPDARIVNCGIESELNLQALLPYQSLEDFTDALPIGSVMMPMIPGEVDAAIATMRKWNDDALVPVRGFRWRAKPVLCFVLNCGPDETIERKLLNAFAAAPQVVASFERAVVHFCDLPPEQDIYDRDGSGPVGRYGYKSGPNWLFRRTMEFARQFGGFALRIDADCTPVQPGWLTSLTDVAAANRHAMVIGSPYLGLEPVGRAFSRHLNGNALYHVGSDTFWSWLDETLWPWLCDVTASTQPSLAYDCAWEAFLSHHLAASDRNDWLKARPLLDKILTTSRIVDIAGPGGVHVEYEWTLADLRRQFPEAVLVHGPFEAAPKAPKVLRLSPLQTIGLATADDSGRASLLGLVRDNNAALSILSVGGEPFEPGDELSVTFTLHRIAPCAIQVQLARHGSTPYEAALRTLPLGDGACAITISHVVKTKVRQFRLQLGRLDAGASADVRIVDLDAGVRRNDGTVVSGSAFKTEERTDAELSRLIEDFYIGAPRRRLLLIDATAIGGCSATGELKAKLLRGVAPIDVLHVLWDYGSRAPRAMFVRFEADRVISCEAGVEAEHLDRLIASFAPDAVLSRPVEGHVALARLADRMQHIIAAPRAIWIMDDLMGRVIDDPEKHEADELLHAAIERASVRWAISPAMAKELEARHGPPFGVLRNGIETDCPTRSLALRSGSPFDPPRLRYSGGLARDMNSEAILAVARAVERLAGRVRFEIATHAHWHRDQASRYSGFRHTTLSVANPQRRTNIRHGWRTRTL